MVNIAAAPYLVERETSFATILILGTENTYLA
jgi:hypothetical protein